MIRTRQRKIHLTLLTGLLLALLSQSGCAKSPSELLVGRWFNGNMTIRFREDSAVIWNSPRGLAKGRYEFSGKTRRLKDQERIPNLFVDVIVNDERQKMRFEIGFIGQDRMRMDVVPMNPATTVSSTDKNFSIVLRRAKNDSILGGAPQKVAQR